MARLVAGSLLWVGALAGAPAHAQIPAPDPPGPYVVDIRGATSAVPQDGSFFPPVPKDTVIPSRGIGIDLGAHIYLIRLGAARLGIGASLLRVRASSSPPEPSPGPTSTSQVAGRPDVEGRLTTFAPQVSFNFGSAEGWSYLSAGLGRAQIKTETSSFTPSGTGTSATPTPVRAVDSGALSSINVGGGARWFAKRHLALSFDVRVHLLSAGAGTVTAPGTPRQTLLAASVGISVR